MKTTTKIKLKKIFSIVMLCFGLNGAATAQCTAAYTYTAGSSGLVSFTDNSTVSNAIYNWNFGDNGGNSMLQSPTHTFIYNGTYNVCLTVRDSVTSCFDSISQSVTITNGITCNLATSFSFTPVGAGQINFTNTSTNIPSGATYYAWNFGDGTGSNQVSPTHTYMYNGTYNASLYIADYTGNCSGTAYQTVTVSNGTVCSMTAAFTYTLGANGQINITNTSTGGNSATDYNWSYGDGSYWFGFSGNHTYSFNGVYTINLHMGDSTTSCSSSISQTIAITNTATAIPCSANYTDSLFANGLTLFIDQSTGTTANTTYQWNFGDGSYAYIQNPTHTYFVNGIYGASLQITDATTGCSSYFTDTVYVTTATGTTSCTPTVSFILHQDSLNPQPGIWEISPNYSSQVSNAIWYWGDGTATSGLYPTHTYTVAGQYNICVTVFSSCGDSSITCQNDSLYRLSNGTNSIVQITVVNSTTGISQFLNNNTNISAFPNPNVGIFNLNVNNIVSAKAQINITNILGEVIYSAQEQVSNNTLVKTIDLQNIANGAYFIKVIAAEKSYTSKIIINK